MCIIIDTNKIHDFLKDSPSDDMQPIRTWIDRKGGLFVYTAYGSYGNELKDVKGRLAVYVRSGHAHLVDIKEIIPEENKLQIINGLKSNDIHILALARASGARLLCTEDRALIDDFKNKEIIDNPRGRIYSGIRQKHLLKQNLCR